LDEDISITLDCFTVGEFAKSVILLFTVWSKGFAIGTPEWRLTTNLTEKPIKIFVPRQQLNEAKRRFAVQPSHSLAQQNLEISDWDHSPPLFPDAPEHDTLFVHFTSVVLLHEEKRCPSLWRSQVSQERWLSPTRRIFFFSFWLRRSTWFSLGWYTRVVQPSIPSVECSQHFLRSELCHWDTLDDTWTVKKFPFDCLYYRLSKSCTQRVCCHSPA